MKKFEELEKLERQMRQTSSTDSNSDTGSTSVSCLEGGGGGGGSDHNAARGNSSGNLVDMEHLSEELFRRTSSETVQHMFGIGTGSSSAGSSSGNAALGSSSMFPRPWWEQHGYYSGDIYGYGYYDDLEEDGSDESDMDDGDYEQEYCDDGEDDDEHYYDDVDEEEEEEEMQELYAENGVHRKKRHNLQGRMQDHTMGISLQDNNNNGTSVQELYALLAYSQRQFSITRQLKRKDPLAVEQVRLPATISRSMAKIIVPLERFKTYTSGNARVRVYQEESTSSKQEDISGTDTDGSFGTINYNGISVVDERLTESFEQRPPSCKMVHVDSILSFDYRSLGKYYEAILIDPPYDHLKPSDLVRTCNMNPFMCIPSHFVLYPRSNLFLYTKIGFSHEGTCSSG